MLISLVVAATTNNVIGRDGDMPWHLPEDLARFREVTMGHAIVMGRRTFESIGRALPGRRNIVLSGDPGYTARGCTVVATPAAALHAAAADDSDEVMVIGGASVYEHFLPLAGRIYMTRIHTDLAGDTFFPPLDSTVWQTVHEEFRPAAGAGRRYALSFLTFERKGPAGRY